MYSYNHRRRLSSVTWTKTVESGITRLLAGPMKSLTHLSSVMVLTENVSCCQTSLLLLDYTAMCMKRCFRFVQKIFFFTHGDVSNNRGWWIKPSLLCLCIVVYQWALWASGIRGHGEFWAHALFWCFVWALFNREGILVFTVTDRPLFTETQLNERLGTALFPNESQWAS